MEKWHKKIRIKVYNPDKGLPDSVMLSGRLSPLTNFLLNVFWNKIQDKNILVAIPDAALRPIPILAYLYAIKCKKSVIVFTKEDNLYLRENSIEKVAHHNSYYLLAEETGKYLFSKVPTGVIYKEKDEKITVKVDIYLPRSKKREYKKKYIDEQKEQFQKKDAPRIILFPDDDYSVINNLEKIYIEKEELEEGIKIDVGLLIFEHLDRFINSEFTFNNFRDWLNAQTKNKKINLLFHFANPQSEFIKRLENDFPSYVLQFTPTFLRGCSNLKNKSIEYFKQQNNEDGRLLSQYNIDNKSFYEHIGDIEICNIPIGNLDLHFANAYNLMNHINSFDQKDKRRYLILQKLLYTLSNLSINPSRYTYRYFLQDTNEWKYLPLEEILQIIENEIDNGEGVVKEYLKRLLLEINCIYHELKECRRFCKENYGYERVGREYKILELAENALRECKVKNVIIAPNYIEELSPIKEEIERLNHSFDNSNSQILVAHVNKVPGMQIDFCNSMLILPAPVNRRTFPLLLTNFKKVVLVAYDGKNMEKTKWQVELSKDSFGDDSISNLKKIYKDLGEDEDILNKDFAFLSEEKKTILPLESDTLQNKNTNDAKSDEVSNLTLQEKIRRLIEYVPSIREAFKDDEVIQNLDIEINELEDKMEDEALIKSREFYSVKLERLGTNEIKECKLPANKTYIRIRDGEQEEVSPLELAENDCIVLFEGKEKRTLLDIVCDTFAIDISIDKRLISIWKDNLGTFVKNKSHDDAYEEYKNYAFEERIQPVTENTFRGWCKGKAIGPGDEKNLRVIGKMINDEEIVRNYKTINTEIEKLRELHRLIGRKVGKIIKEILSGNVETTRMSREELMLYNEINNNIYSILEIEKMQ